MSEIISVEETSYLLSSDQSSVVVESSEVATLISVDRLIISNPSTGGNSVEVSKTLPAGETISALNVLYQESGQWLKALASDVNVSGRALFLAQTSATTGGSVEAICFGLVSDNSWNWDLALPLLLGEGQISQSVPSSGMIVQLGKVISSSQILFNPLSEVLI